MYICIYIHTYLDLSTSIYSGQQELPGNQNGNDATGYPKEVATVPLLKLAKEEARPLSVCFICAICINFLLVLPDVRDDCSASFRFRRVPSRFA